RPRRAEQRGAPAHRLARAPLNRPLLLRADEPTDNLDRDNAALVLGEPLAVAGPEVDAARAPLPRPEELADALDGRPDFLASRSRPRFALLGSPAGPGPAPAPPPSAYAAGPVPSGARSAPTPATSSGVQVCRAVSTRARGQARCGRQTIPQKPDLG